MAADSRLVRLVRSALDKNSGALRLVAERCGVSYSWVCKVKQGKLKEPGCAQVERVVRTFFGGVYTRSEIEFVLRQHVTQAQAGAIVEHLERLVPDRPQVSPGPERTAAQA